MMPLSSLSKEHRVRPGILLERDSGVTQGTAWFTRFTTAASRSNARHGSEASPPSTATRAPLAIRATPTGAPEEEAEEPARRCATPAVRDRPVARSQPRAALPARRTVAPATTRAACTAHRLNAGASAAD